MKKPILLLFIGLCFVGPLPANAQSGIITPKIQNVVDLPPELHPLVWARYKASRIGVSNGSPITVWPDISGNDRHATAPAGDEPVMVTAAAGLLGSNTFAVDFTANSPSWFNLPSMAAMAEGEAFFYVLADSATAGIAGGGLYRTGSSIAQTLYASGTGAIQDNWGTATFVNAGNPGSVAAWRNYNPAVELALSPAVHSVRFDNVITSAGYNTRSISFIASPTIGIGLGDTNNFNGRIAEVIILHTPATPAQRTAVHDYFVREYRTP